MIKQFGFELVESQKPLTADDLEVNDVNLMA